MLADELQIESRARLESRTDTAFARTDDPYVRSHNADRVHRAGRENRSRRACATTILSPCE